MADSFQSGNAEPVLDADGNPTGFLKQRTSRGREQLIKPVVPGDKSLTPNQAGAQLMNRGRIIQFQLKNLTGDDQETADQKTLLNQELGFIKSKLGNLTSPRAPQVSRPTMSDEDLAALFGGEDQSQEQSIPEPPKNPLLRRKDQTYKTPKGVFKWTGTGWQSSQ